MSSRARALDLALAWPKYSEKTLGDLVERIHEIPDEDQVKVWNLIDGWAESQGDEKARASLRERIRQFAFTRWGRRRDLNDGTRDRARVVYEKLQPVDPVVRHTWLFVSDWVELSDDDLQDEDVDQGKDVGRIRDLRVTAMKEIWEERGFEGLKALLSGGGIPGVTGSFLALHIVDASARIDFLQECLSVVGDMEKEMDGCIKGFLRSVDDEVRKEVLLAAVEDTDTDRIVRLLRCAPFGQDTWGLLDQHGGEVRDRYWWEVVPEWNRQGEAELNELVDSPPRCEASSCRLRCSYIWIGRRIETGRLKRLLRAIATEDTEPVVHLETYYISTALESLDGRTGVTRDEMAQFEFMFLGALDHGEHGIPNLERHIAENPTSFVQVLAFMFKRDDGKEDPPEWRIEDPERRRRAGPPPPTIFCVESGISREQVRTEGSIPRRCVPGWTKYDSFAPTTAAARSGTSTSVSFFPEVRRRKMASGRTLRYAR